MPRDLFGNVTRPSMSIGNRKWYTVPVSLLSHALVLALIVVVPILAAPLMPGVLGNNALEAFIKIVPPTPPPLPSRKPVASVEPVVNTGAPIDAPTGINPEKPQPPSGWERDVPTGTVLADVDLTVAPPPPVKVVPPEPVRPGAGVRTPQKVHDVSPVYPQIAQMSRVQGIVIIEATIGEDGRVTNARILRSVPLLDQAALDAVQQWQYTPTTLNGVRVPVIMTVTVNFTLK